MKKILLSIMAMLALGTTAFADATTYTYVVTVEVICEYAYYSQENGFLGRQSAPSESQTFRICAESEGAAIRDALYQCSRMCENDGNGQYLGKATFGGETCSKYLVRRTGKTVAKRQGTC